jgi:HlyD family secretion protein
MLKPVLSIAACVLLAAACGTKQEKIQPAEEKIIESVYASGFIKSKNQYQVFAAVNGLVAAVLVKEGDTLKKGTPLIRLSDVAARLNTENASLAADYAAVTANQEKLNELKVSIDQARAKMNNDASLLERQRNLWNQQIGSRNELDQRQLAYTTSLHNYEQAQLRYSELQKQISFQARQAQKNLELSAATRKDYIIKSDRDGRVYSILKEPGEMVNTQSPVALIGDAAAFSLELQVDEYDIARIKVGQKIALSMDSYKEQVFEAVVEKINPLMNERSKSFTIEAAFITRPPELYPNLTCEANIIIVEKDKALTIPRAYLIEGSYVLLSTKEKRKVVTGLKDYQKVEIRSGLTAKDYIIKPAP